MKTTNEQKIVQEKEQVINQKKSKNNGLVKGAIVISLGMIIAKVLGAFYRAPLTNLIGANGIGIYQMVFPFYCIMLTVSSSGVPNAISKLVAEGANGKKCLYKSIIGFGALGLMGSVLMFCFAEKLAIWQGNQLATLSYKMLSPSVFFVALISCYRGYFQGHSQMMPTAVSQIVEQIFKLVFALVILNIIKTLPHYQAALASLAVSFSEFCALIYFVFRYHLRKSVLEDDGEVAFNKMLKTVAPIAFSAILLPLARVIDSFLVINLLNLETSVATAEYGIYTGGVESIIGVSVAICYGFAVSGIPYIAKNKKNEKASKKIMLYTFFTSIILCALTFVFARLGINVLYSRLSEENRMLMTNLVRFSAIQIVLLSCMQSATSVLIAKDRLLVAPLNLAIGVAVKIVLIILLTKNPNVGIYAMAISDISCYFVAVVLHLLYINSVELKIKRSEKKFNQARINNSL